MGYEWVEQEFKEVFVEDSLMEVGGVVEVKVVGVCVQVEVFAILVPRLGFEREFVAMAWVNMGKDIECEVKMRESMEMMISMIIILW
jgi:hypothetical protein